MHDNGAGLPLKLILESECTNLVKSMPSIESNFSLNIFCKNKYFHKHSNFVCFIRYVGPILNADFDKYYTAGHLPDQKSGRYVTFFPFETPVVNALESDITDSFLFISSNGKFFSTVPQVMCIINLYYTVVSNH